MKPFMTKEYYSPSTIEKILKKIPQKNVLIDINNLFANESLSNISKEQIKTIENKYQIENLAKTYKKEIIELLNDFIDNNLGNLDSHDNDFQSAKKFQELLGISDADFNKEYEPIANKVFKDRVEDIINFSKKFEDEEETKIEQLRLQFGIQKEKAEQISIDCRKNIVQNFVNNMIADSRVSPVELTVLDVLQKSLSVEVNMGEESKLALEKYKLLWIIENSELPAVEADILLPKGEQCYINCYADLYENRRITKSISYAGPTFRMKIAKGIYYRAGNVGIGRQTEDKLVLVDNGKLYITNKRILFVGKTNKTIKYNQIIDITPYSDGVEIIKDSGKSPTFLLDGNDGEIVSAIIARVISDLHQ